MTPRIEDYIFVVDGVLSRTVCKGILDEYAKSSEWSEMLIGSGLDRTVRATYGIHVSTDKSKSINPFVRQDIDNALFQGVSLALHEYKTRFPRCQVNSDSGYELLRYGEGEFYKEHTDSFTDKPRSISCSIALNDDYEGGEFAFFNRSKKYKIGAGSAIVFPSNFMFPHEILTVTKGTRYAVVTWLI